MAHAQFQAIVALVLLSAVYCIKPSVRTTSGRVQGNRVQGFHRLMNVYLGIPYAEPPVGELRFRRPEPVRPWNGTLSANRFSKPCYHEHYSNNKETESKNISENCLFLNIWVPYMRNSERLATLVWLPDNGRRSDVNSEIFDGNYLAAENDVIVVGVNYRVGALGFLYSGNESSPGNMGLLDQAMAIKWLYNNIEHFGGDKHRLTLFGDGLGATSVSLHLLSPVSRTYFSNAAMQKGGLGGTTSFIPNSKALKYTELLASKVGCTNEDLEETMKCLNSVEIKTILENQDGIYINESRVFAGPTVDEYFLTKSPKELLDDGLVKNANIIAGVNSVENHLSDEEASSSAIRNFVPVHSEFGLDAIRHEYRLSLLPSRRPTMRELFDDIVHDHNVVCPTVEFANAYAKTFPGSESVFVFMFDHNIVRNHKKGEEMGKFVDMVFGLPFRAANYTDAEKVLCSDIMRFFSNFVKTGNPNRENRYERRNEQWPAYHTEEQKYITFRTEKPYDIGQGMRYAKCSFWRNLYPKVNGLQGAVCSSVNTVASAIAIVLMLILSRCH